MIIPPVRIVPVLDLKGGVVVHARHGDRTGYRPLCSPLVDGCEPVAVARALCAHARSGRLYVADLDALRGAPIDVATIASLSEVAELWVDAGATSAEQAMALGGAGAARNVVGTESIGSPPAALAAALAHGPPPALSVDLRDGRLISPLDELAGGPPPAAAPIAQALRACELLVIDLARVGAGAGPALQAVAGLSAALPDAEIYAGGGVRDDADLRALERAGAAGALVATALHAGAVTV